MIYLSRLLFIISATVSGFIWFQNTKYSTCQTLAGRKYPISNPQNSYYRNYKIAEQIKRLNSKNLTTQLNEILTNEDLDIDESVEKINQLLHKIGIKQNTTKVLTPTPRVKLNQLFIPLVIKEYEPTPIESDNDFNDDYHDDDDDNELDYHEKTEYERNKNKYEEDDDQYDMFGRPRKPNKQLVFQKMKTRKKALKKSENFEMNSGSSLLFKDIGGYDNIKRELDQCIDIISNYTKYAAYNVRVPKGLIFEGPPGNGKTLFAKALAGEANTNFIAVSGSQFQDKYVGVGSSKVRELFSFAKENLPCIIFIDEIDAVGRKRSSDGEASSGERDNTLNELLVALDGFKNMTGVFVIGATNRPDLLDSALTRPGRIDKRIFIGNPDVTTRKSIIEIHSKGKPYDKESVSIEDLIEQTNGLSGAQIENLLNEAMLNALREDRYIFDTRDLDVVMNKMIAGWQPSEHQLSKLLIDQIAIHEMGHAVVGMVCKHHAKMTKVIINLSAPRSPAYTVFENTANGFLTREYLFEHLMVLLSGRIAEETFYDVSVTTGAINDFEEALKLAEKMICYYGMGTNIIYPSLSDKYKEMIDLEVSNMIHQAYQQAKFIINNFKDLIDEGAERLKDDKVLTYDTLADMIEHKYKHVYENMINIRFCK